MAFLAIVHAPALRTGARLCIADLAQTLDQPPGTIVAGAEVHLRFGTCCPDLADGAIGDRGPDSDEATLEVAAGCWTIRRAIGSGIGIPGLVAEDWFVVDA